MSDGIARISRPASCARPFAADHPIRSPVKLPGPSPTTMPSRSPGRTLSRRSTKSTNRVIAAAWRRVPCTCAPLSATGGRPAATLAMSVAVSMASQWPLIPAPPSAECGMRNAELRRTVRSQRLATPIDTRTVHSAFRTPHSALVSPYLFEHADIRLVTVAQLEVPIQRRRPRASPLRPFDQHDGSLPGHVVECQVARLVGRLEPVAIHVVDRTSVGCLVVMHEGVGGAGGEDAGAQALADRLDQGRFPGAELARKPDDRSAGEVAPERLTEPLELVRGQVHDGRCRPRPGARGSGRATGRRARSRALRRRPASGSRAAQ